MNRFAALADQIAALFDARDAIVALTLAERQKPKSDH
jgi:hypothetical protein